MQEKSKTSESRPEALAPTQSEEITYNNKMITILRQSSLEMASQV